MIPWQLLGEHSTPDGTKLRLMKHDRDMVITADGKMLMSSRMHGSEEELAALGCKHLAKADNPRVLVGGLGLGYTLRATLDLLPESAEVVVAELVEGVVEWNRGPLGPLASHPLKDPRVKVAIGDVGKTMRLDKAGFDAILLDVDNGPDGLTRPENQQLYSREGLRTAKAALRPGGLLAVWSAAPDKAFTRRLTNAGFAVEELAIRARQNGKGPRHVIWLATHGSR